MGSKIKPEKDYIKEATDHQLEPTWEKIILPLRSEQRVAFSVSTRAAHRLLTC